jgi:hypothetical protein
LATPNYGYEKRQKELAKKKKKEEKLKHKAERKIGEGVEGGEAREDGADQVGSTAGSSTPQQPR